MLNAEGINGLSCRHNTRPEIEKVESSSSNYKGGSRFDLIIEGKCPNGNANVMKLSALP